MAYSPLIDNEDLLKEDLEIEIVQRLAEALHMGPQDALSVYYKSKLAHQIHEGAFGIQYLDAGYLVDDLLRNESELFK